jgi:hypothetical protein
MLSLRRSGHATQSIAALPGQLRKALSEREHRHDTWARYGEQKRAVPRQNWIDDSSIHLLAVAFDPPRRRHDGAHVEDYVNRWYPSILSAHVGISASDCPLLLCTRHPTLLPHRR